MIKVCTHVLDIHILEVFGSSHMKTEILHVAFSLQCEYIHVFEHTWYTSILLNLVQSPIILCENMKIQSELLSKQIFGDAFRRGCMCLTIFV